MRLLPAGTTDAAAALLKGGQPVDDAIVQAMSGQPAAAARMHAFTARSVRRPAIRR